MASSTSSSSSTLRTGALNEGTEFVVVSYPGVVKNVDRAIDTLGGQQVMNATHFAGRPLELRHRPENPYANALVSERRSLEKASFGTGVLLAIVKVRRKKANPNVVEAKILGLVSTLYTFKSMCDFQYLPLKKADSSDEHFEDLVPKLIPQDLPGALSWWERPDSVERTQLFLPPYQFSRYNTPSTKILCRETDFSLDKLKKRTAGHGQSLRSERKALSVTVHADDVFPTEPSEDAVADANIRCKNEEPHRMLKELFEERPLWTRVAIVKKTGLEEFLLKTLLQKFAFYVLNGPWGRLWCRFGYDPRTDPKAKMYQSVMVTFRQHTKIPERQRLKVVNLSTDRALPVSLTGKVAVTSFGSFSQIGTESVDYCYVPGQLPHVRQMWYCICDVKLPVAEEIVRKEYFAQGEQADLQNGWLPAEATERVRRAIKEDVKNVSRMLDEDDDGEGTVAPDVAEDEWVA